MSTDSGSPSSMETLSEAIERLRGDGYVVDWRVDASALACSECDGRSDPSTLTIDEVVRFEGMSDPGDEAVLFAITGECGHRGTWLAPYGPDVAPDDVAVAVALHRRES